MANELSTVICYGQVLPALPSLLHNLLLDLSGEAIAF
jgi:hypothetical protein